ncbi:glycosyltransferase family 9 protein [Pseudoclavibacter sp. AY1F1]|uniref:glycosyltransferase family 9 protein n=1 Tax=Pseudoclavibacter sp. AY1F1 TaxID=2080583 RepID=UPI000CE7FD08|nr:glycosyltransferase family 9 protein [Pseudoclavibacter sp. AY1F1]PPF42720.1 glycosyltransferase family 9 protein [Pseudoclavibacter sp. AY1F1]
MSAIAPPAPRFDDVRKIAVLRAGGLGDVLFALPAMQALASAYPDAEVTLLGTRLAKELLEDRPGAPHRVVVLPPVPGVGVDPDAVVDSAEVARFLEAQRAERYDLAVQVHGGGRYSNPFLLALGARHTIGTRTSDAAQLERNLEYVYYQHEMLRALEVAGLAGAPAVALEPELAVSEGELARGRVVRGAGAPTVVVHPGATDPRRRWPTEKFGEIAALLARRGVRVVLVGEGEDAALAADIIRMAGQDLDDAARRLLVDCSAQLTLSELAGVFASCDVVLGNDSGPRHLALAVGARTVGIFWFGNLINAGPLGRGRHRALLSWVTACPVCGRDSTQVGWTAPRCEHDVSFVADVAVEEVLAEVLSLLGAARSGRRSD